MSAYTHHANMLGKKAVENTSRKIPVKSIVVGIKVDILKEEWI